MTVTLGEALSVLAWLGTMVIGVFAFRGTLEKARQELRDQVTELRSALTGQIGKLDTELRLLGQAQGTEASVHRDRLVVVERDVESLGRDIGKLDQRIHDLERAQAVAQASQHSPMFARDAVQSGDSGMSPATRRPQR